jgi:hypothetical protein
MKLSGVLLGLLALGIVACDAPATSTTTGASSAAPALVASASAAPQGAGSGTGSAEAGEAPLVGGAPSGSAALATSLGGVGSAPVAGAAQAAAPVDESLAVQGVLPAGVADQVLKAGEPPKVVLLSAGAEPREALSYLLEPGVKQTTVMSMDMTMSMAPEGAAVPQKAELPTIEMSLDLSSGAKDPGGDIAITGVVGGIGIVAKPGPQEQLKGMLEPALAGIKGLSINYKVSPKGRARDVKVGMPANAPANAQQMMEQMKQSFESMVAPLPDEAIGVGAEWQVVTRISTGADILQWTNYKLVSRNGKNIELAAVVKQLAASGVLSGGQLPPGVTAEVLAFRSSGTGSSSVELSQLAPSKGLGDVRSSITVSGGGQKMSIDTEVRIAFGPKK